MQRFDTYFIYEPKQTKNNQHAVINVSRLKLGLKLQSNTNSTCTCMYEREQINSRDLTGSTS